jgi:hypothetical protein
MMGSANYLGKHSAPRCIYNARSPLDGQIEGARQFSNMAFSSQASLAINSLGLPEGRATEG